MYKIVLLFTLSGIGRNGKNRTLIIGFGDLLNAMLRSYVKLVISPWCDVTDAPTYGASTWGKLRFEFEIRPKSLLRIQFWVYSSPTVDD